MKNLMQVFIILSFGFVHHQASWAGETAKTIIKTTCPDSITLEPKAESGWTVTKFQANWSKTKYKTAEHLLECYYAAVNSTGQVFYSKSDSPESKDNVCPKEGSTHDFYATAKIVGRSSTLTHETTPSSDLYRFDYEKAASSGGTRKCYYSESRQEILSAGNYSACTVSGKTAQCTLE